MFTLRKADAGRWINALLAIASILCAYVFYSFLVQINEWFALEAKFAYYTAMAQAISVGLGVLLFIYLLKYPDVKRYLDEVYSELLKVVWPETDSTTKLTIGIIVAVVLCSVFFGVVDFVAQKLLGLLY